MARKVTTVLSLRDNYTAVIKKARRYTSAFDKDMQKITARLDKASAGGCVPFMSGGATTQI